MKVAVLNSLIPFGWGGAEELASHLVRRMTAVGIRAELVRIPFSWEPAERLLEQLTLCGGLRLDSVDRIIGLRFPAYLVPHRQKVLWLLHQFRQAYDLWDAGQTNIADDFRGRQIREAVRHADNACFAACQGIFTNHRTTHDRLLRYNNVESEILMPPLNDPELFRGGEPQGYILACGRVARIKRQSLLLEAMRHVSRNVRLVIAGPPDVPEDATRLEAMIRAWGLEDQVTLHLTFLPREELAHWVNKATAVAYIPFDEDSVGYVTMEAFHAAKPVITTDDSGGVLDLVKDHQNGLVAAPDARSLAAALEFMHTNPSTAARWGRQAQQDWLERDVTWGRTLDRLLS